MKEDFLENIENLTIKDFVEMDIATFYNAVASIMQDLNYSFHRSVRDVQNYRRIEIWKHVKNHDDFTLVWVEIVKAGDDVTRDVSYEVLRTLNDLNMVKLAFFTNGGIDDDTKDVIDDKGHFIFTPDNIIETLLAIKKRNDIVIKPKLKRKKPKTPSGFVLIRNFLKENKPKEVKTIVPIKLIPEFRAKLIDRFNPVMDLVSSIEDIDNIDAEVRKKIKAFQFAMLTDLINIASLEFEEPFQWMKEDFFYMVQNYILYLGALAEFETVEEMDKYLEEFNRRKNNLFEYEVILSKIKEKQVTILNDTLEKLKKVSIYLLVAAIIFLIIFILL
ncbi:MAG: hypothetical protein LDL13_02825 [Calditerrivibrio sp.]|nr:hypothetical protein [Calditerrivibrio sp.]MCA1932495.1 hypothetical protein [Calditerrivibrio sp.]MCA1980832.1 hypothetical protein [Calditerrivibrio sp.]